MSVEQCSPSDSQVYLCNNWFYQIKKGIYEDIDYQLLHHNQKDLSTQSIAKDRACSSEKEH